MKRLARLLIPVMALSLTAPAALGASPGEVLPGETNPAVAESAAAAATPFLRVSEVERPLAQGLTLTAIDRLYPHGWVRAWLLTADLSNPAVTSDLLTAPAVTKGEPLSEMAKRTGAIAAINGDFFDIGQTGIALGSVVKGGQYLQTPIPDWPLAAGVSPDGIGRLVEITLEGSVTLPQGTYPLGQINLPTVQGHSIGLYTPLWTIDRSRATVGATEATEVIVRQGMVVSVSPTVTEQPVPSDGFVLVGREEYAAPLAALKVGDEVTLSYRPKPDLKWAVGGRQHLVKDGEVVSGLNDTQRAPRSAVGFSWNGRKLYLLTVEGRNGSSGGLTLKETAELIRSFGALNALELDGGGSTTMVARLPGQTEAGLIGQPSDGRERAIPNGIGIYAAPGSGTAKVLELIGEGRLFPGLSRWLTALAFDEQYSPVAVESVTWTAEGARSVSPEGLVRADQSGRITVTAEAAAEGLRAAVDLRVLGLLQRIEASPGSLRLAPGEAGRFTVRGYDADGYSAPIDPGDLVLDYDVEMWKVEYVDGAVQVTPLKEGAGLIKVAVQGRTAYVPVVSGQAATALNWFERTENWKFAQYPATVSGSLSKAEGRSGAGLKLSYTFGPNPAGGNRAAYAEAAVPLELPTGTKSFGLWVKGDGHGAWLRAVVIDGGGTSRTVDLARHVDWTDWKYVEATLPSGIPQPVRLHRIYPVETDQAKNYTGELVFADFTVKSPLELPEVPDPALPAADPILQPGGSERPEGAWTFALLHEPPAAGAQPVDPQAQALLIPRLPDSKEALAALAQVAGDVPVRSLEGTNGSFAFDLNQVRFVSLQGSGDVSFEQMAELKQVIDNTRADRTIRRLIVLGTDSPLRLTDPRKGDLILQWLSEFEEQSGKEAAYLVTGGSSLGVQRVEGIPIVEAGSPGEPLHFTIDLTPGATWLRVEAQ